MVVRILNLGHDIKDINTRLEKFPSSDVRDVFISHKDTSYPTFYAVVSEDETSQQHARWAKEKNAKDRENSVKKSDPELCPICKHFKDYCSCNTSIDDSSLHNTEGI